MGALNLYKIDSSKKQIFIQELSNKMNRSKVISIPEDDNGIDEDFDLTLFFSQTSEPKSIKWNWLLERYGENEVQVDTSPSAVLLIEREDRPTYAATFGHSFFIVDKFADQDFGFDFARKIPFEFNALGVFSDLRDSVVGHNKIKVADVNDWIQGIHIGGQLLYSTGFHGLHLHVDDLSTDVVAHVVDAIKNQELFFNIGVGIFDITIACRAHHITASHTDYHILLAFGFQIIPIAIGLIFIGFHAFTQIMDEICSAAQAAKRVIQYLSVVIRF